MEMNLKELNTKSYKINSKYKKHTGIKVSCTQASRSWHEDKSRDWRKKEKDRINYNKRSEIKKNMENLDFNCQDKCVKIKDQVLDV